MGNKILIGILIVLVFLLGIGTTLGYQHIHNYKTIISTPVYFLQQDIGSFVIGDYQTSQVITNSMLPTIPIGSTMIMVPIKKEATPGTINLQLSNAIPVSDLKLYDIVCFKTPQFTKGELCHRITKIKNTSSGKEFYTIGDNDNTGAGIWINASQVDYKVVGVLY